MHAKVQRLSRKGVEFNKYKFEMEENLKQSIKYIVYLTVCKVNKKIYVGVHTTPNPNKFDGYLGNGVYINKPSSYKKNLPGSGIFPRAVNKYGPSNFIRITLFTFNTLQEAFDKEREIVTEEFIKRADTYNVALGGGVPPKGHTKVVHQYTLNGDYITSYSSVREAAATLKIKECLIGQSIKRNGSAGDYLWSFDKYDKIETRSDKTAARKVAVYDKNGNFVKEYPTIIACKKDYCGCVHVLYGTRKHCKGCTFKFID